MPKRLLSGIVVSSKSDKTIVVIVNVIVSSIVNWVIKYMTIGCTKYTAIEYKESNLLFVFKYNLKRNVAIKIIGTNSKQARLIILKDLFI